MRKKSFKNLFEKKTIYKSVRVITDINYTMIDDLAYRSTVAPKITETAPKHALQSTTIHTGIFNLKLLKNQITFTPFHFNANFWPISKSSANFHLSNLFFQVALGQ